MQSNSSVNSTDLENALKVVRITVGSSSDIASHYVFRAKNGGLEVLSNDGRTFASCVVPHATTTDVHSFTVEARRIHALLDSVGPNQVLDVNADGSEVLVKTVHGKVPFSSLDPSLFPYWDDVLNGAKVTAKVPAERLFAAFNHAKQFIYDQEAKAPQLCLAEFRNGVLYSTDQMAVSLVKVAGMEKASLKVYVKSLGNVLAFLQTAKSEDVEILEADRASFIRRADGAVFGETVYAHQFPNIKVDWDLVDDQTWELSQEVLVARLKTLQAGARLEEPRVKFSREGNELTLMMTSVGGKPIKSQPIPLTEVTVKEGETSELPPFTITDTYIGKILNGNGNQKIRLGVSKKGAGGWVRIRDTRNGDSYLTTVAWLKNA